MRRNAIRAVAPLVAAALLAACSDTAAREPLSSDGGIDAPADALDAGSSDTDGGPTCPPDCSDGVVCTIDSCVDGACAHEVADWLCGACGVCDVTRDCIVGCSGDFDCDDAQFCNGAERCEACICRPGSLPDCDDGDACTTDSCDEWTLRACVHAGRDDDGDGHFAESVLVDGASSPCPGGTDCDDDNAGVRPGASEACNAIDDDCDGAIDEGPFGPFMPCGSDVGACRPGTWRCVAGTYACEGAVAGTPETCVGCAFVDEDCDGTIDESCEPRCGMTRLCGSDVGECVSGTQLCTGAGGTWSTCTGGIDPTPEACANALDEDCDGATDEGCP